MNQIGNVVVQNTKRRLLVGCLTFLIGVPVICCGFFVFFNVLFPLIDTMAKSESGNNNAIVYLLAGIAILATLFLFGVPLLIAIFIIRKRAKYLDGIFFPIGLKGEMYLLYGRHYWGQFGGREVDVYIYRGPTLEVHMSTNGTTRFQVMPKGSLPVAVGSLFTKGAMPLPVPELEPYSIYPVDETWTRNLLQDSRAATAILTLMSKGLDWAIFRHVEVQPGAVLLFINRSKKIFSNLSQLNEMQPWLSALKDLSEAVDAQPQPEITAQPMPSTSRESRQKRSKWTAYIILFIIFGMPLCFIAVAALVYFLVTLLPSSGGF
jgi:hypothetical protein